jgi:hypothetical protein
MNLLGGTPAATAPAASESAQAAVAPTASAAPPAASAAPAPSASAGVPEAAPAPSASAAASAAPSSVASAPPVAPKEHKHSWPKAEGKPPPTPRNTDWLPKESEIPKIAEPSTPPPAPAPTNEAAP